MGKTCHAYCRCIFDTGSPEGVIISCLLKGRRYPSALKYGSGIISQPECGSELDYQGEVRVEQLELVSRVLKVNRTERIKSLYKM